MTVLTCVVIVYKSNRITVQATLSRQTGIIKFAPVTTIGESIIDIPLHREIKGCTLNDAIHLRTIYPVYNTRQALFRPIFTYGIGWFGCDIIISCETGAVATYHIVTESHITKVVKQEIKIGFDILLHIPTRVVQIASTIPISTSVQCTCGVPTAILRLVILADVSSRQMIGLTSPDLSGEVQPVTVHTGAVVDHHILYDTCAFLLKGVNH